MRQTINTLGVNRKLTLAAGMPLLKREWGKERNQSCGYLGRNSPNEIVANCTPRWLPKVGLHEGVLLKRYQKEGRQALEKEEGIAIEKYRRRNSSKQTCGKGCAAKEAKKENVPWDNTKQQSFVLSPQSKCWEGSMQGAWVSEGEQGSMRLCKCVRNGWVRMNSMFVWPRFPEASHYSHYGNIHHTINVQFLLCYYVLT